MADRADWRNCKVSKEEEIQMVNDFKQGFSKFDPAEWKTCLIPVLLHLIHNWMHICIAFGITLESSGYVCLEMGHYVVKILGPVMSECHVKLNIFHFLS